MSNIANFVQGIDPANKSLAFIDHRLAFASYRGLESSQHNRYTINDAFTILNILNSMRPNKELLYIRTADTSKRPFNTPEEYDYAELCNKAKTATGIGTQDAMRKNLFVDWHRMGLIHRYNARKEMIKPFAKSSIKYVSLSDLGLTFIQEQNLVKRNFLFSKLLNEFLAGFVQSVLDVITTTDLDFVTQDEMMLFVSAINHPDYGITVKECETLIKEYRTLSRLQKSATIGTLKEKLVPKKFKGDKTVKRDFHNWVNKYAQIWNLFKDLPFFIVNEDQLYLTSSKSQSDSYNRKDMNRSPQAKKDYFTNHKVNKTHGYELDHVIPLLFAKSIQEFHYLDDWQNLLYIDGKTHAIKTQKGSKHMILEQHPDHMDKMILSDFNGDRLLLSNGDQAMFNPSLTQNMIDYNAAFLAHSNLS